MRAWYRYIINLYALQKHTRTENEKGGAYTSNKILPFGKKDSTKNDIMRYKARIMIEKDSSQLDKKHFWLLVTNIGIPTHIVWHSYQLIIKDNTRGLKM